MRMIPEGGLQGRVGIECVRGLAAALPGVSASGMPQLQLPLFCEGVHLITANLGYRREGDDIVYLHGMMPVFLHRCDDLASFKMIVSQFYLNGNARQAELVRAFAVQPQALKRWVKKYRAAGPKAFFESRRNRRTTLKKSPRASRQRRHPTARNRSEARPPQAFRPRLAPLPGRLPRARR